MEMLMISPVQSSQVALLYVGPLFIKKETWISYMPLLQGILVRKYTIPPGYVLEPRAAPRMNTADQEIAYYLR